jgi:hypothetical protein
MHDCYATGIAARSTLLVYPPLHPPAGARIPDLTVESSVPEAMMSGGRADTVRLGATRVIATPEWMEVLASASRGGIGEKFPVTAIGKIAGGRIGLAAFDIRGHFLLDPDKLDALVATIDLLKDLTAPGDVQIVATGAYVSVPAADPARVTRPDGRTLTLAPDKWGRVQLRPLEQGSYTIESNGLRVEVYANYFDAAESDLGAANVAAPAASAVPAVKAASEAAPRQMHPLTFAMVVLALLALLAESAILVRHAARWRAWSV